MRFEQANLSDDKGWYAGPWDSDLAVSVGFANKGIDQPHIHAQITEIYLVARGTAEIRVEQQTIGLSVGDVIIVDPDEAHTFLSSSPDYYHFVIHTPGLIGERACTEKSSVPRSRLGL
jgi:mannose-6-phosphate isomerase-like protein (cupin superfamily)